jgi:hypothetical protein
MANGAIERKHMRMDSISSGTRPGHRCSKSERLETDAGFLGHSSIGITSDVYVHLQLDSEVESMTKLEGTFFSELCSRPKLKVKRE